MQPVASGTGSWNEKVRDIAAFLAAPILELCLALTVQA